MDRRDFLRISAALLGTTIPVPKGVAAAAAGGATGGRAADPLMPMPFVPLALGAVRATGWLHKQLELQRDGLTGASEKIYDDLGPGSGWLGGEGESWERGPYYVKGLVALAYVLGDETLKRRARKWIDWVLASQRPSGMFGPVSNNDWWPRMVVLYYLRDYYDTTGDKRVIPFLTRYFHHQLRELPGRPLSDWSKARAGDNIDAALWTYRQTGDEALIDLADLLRRQAYDWTSIYTDNRFYDFGDDFHPRHIVNVSQALRMPAVVYQFTRSPADRDAFMAGVAHLDRQYGRIDGQVSGTEMLSDLNSTAGTEFCADVERVLSNQIAMHILGDPRLGDQLEAIAFNSATAHATAAMKQISYYQFPNQVSAAYHHHGFEQDYPNGNMRSPHSGFPCCCYNWHHGWPNYVKGMWARAQGGGLGLLAYGPCEVTAAVGGAARPVTIREQTDYPFRDTVTLRLAMDQPVTFPLVLRIPGWCERPRVAVNGEAVGGVAPGSFHRLQRTWANGDAVVLTFPMRPRVSTWINGSAGVSLGPVAYSFPVKEDRRPWRDYYRDFDAYESLTAGDWNYGLVLDEGHPERGITVERAPMTDMPFVAERSPLRLKVPARKVPGWGVQPGGGRVILGKADGNWHPLATAERPIDAGAVHHVKVDAQGDRLRIYVDDMTRPAIDHTDGAFASGHVGLRSWHADARFANVTLNGKPLDGPPGDGWTVHDGDWSSRRGAAVAAGDQRHKAVYRGPAVDDFVYRADVTLDQSGSAHNAGLIFRVRDARSGTDAYRGYYVGLTAGLPAKARDAQEPPPSPVASSEPIEEIALVPYGSTTLRVSYFPRVSR